MTPADRRAVILGSVMAGSVIALQVGAKAARDTLFLSQFDVVALARVMVAAAALSLPAVLGVSRAMARWKPARTISIAYAINAALFVGEWVTMGRYPSFTAVVVYLHAAIFGIILVSGFWSVLNERFDPHRARRSMGRFVGGATLGGAAGGLLAERFSTAYGLRMTLLALAGLSVLCAVGVDRLGAETPGADAPAPREPGAGFKLLRSTPYLRHFATIVALTSATAVLVQYALQAKAAATHESSEELMTFFSVFYGGTNVLTFLVGAPFTRPALKKLGLAGTIALLPGAVMATGLFSVGLTRLWSIVLLAGTERILANSLFRSAYEVLFTPLPAVKKRLTKAIVDVIFDRVGEAVGSGVALLALAAVPQMAIQVVIIIAIGISAYSLLVSRRLGADYLSALVDALRSGVVRLSRSQAADATTLRALNDTQRELEREALLEEIRRLREIEAQGGSRESLDELAVSPRARRPASSVSGAAERLSSKDPERIRRSLREPLDPGLLPEVIELLGHDDLRRDALIALRRFGAAVAPELVEFLHDQDVPVRIRKRLPTVLKELDSQAALDGLVDALGDPRFAVRYEAAQALSHKMLHDPDLKLPTEPLLDAARRELEMAPSDWERHGALEPERPSPWIETALRDEVHPNLEHVFTLLSLVLDREALALVLQAILSDDDSLRRTALEYVDNVVPQSIRRALRGHLQNDLHRSGGLAS